MDRNFDVIVAGGGIAGLSAGAVSAGLGRTTLVLTGGMLGGHLLSIERIEGLPGFPDGIAGFELCPALQEEAAVAGAAFAMTEAEHMAPDGDGWRIATGDGDYTAPAVIVATGAALKALGVAGEARLQGKGVSHCASCDAPLLQDRPVAVIGGGDSAMQEALTLADFCSWVTIVQRGADLTGQVSFRDRVCGHPKIDIRCNTEAREILGGNTVSGVRISDTANGATDDLEVDGVFIYIGLEPATSLLDGRLELDPSGHIPVDGSMRTVLAGVFAAGGVRAAAPGRAVASAGDGAAAAIAADRYLTDGGWRR